MRDFLNQSDVDAALEDGNTRSTGSRQIRFADGLTTVWILSRNHEYGQVHWIEGDNDKPKRVVCGGGAENQGWAPDECQLCDYVRGLYAAARETQNKREADGYKAQAARMKAKFEATFIAVKGDIVKTRFKAPGGGYKDMMVPTFDTEDSFVGLLSLSYAQYKSFVGLVKEDTYPFITGLDNLLDRPLVFEKKQRGNDRFKTVHCRPGSRTPQEIPDLEWDEESFTSQLVSLYEVNHENIASVVARLEGLSGDETEVPPQVDDEDLFEDSL